jgi:transcriptional regulator with XRE-family HTH domain
VTQWRRIASKALIDDVAAGIMPGERYMSAYSEFGNRIRELREAKKQIDPAFSLRRFAQAVGISATFLSKIETGMASPPSVENIKKMAELLEVDADELLALAGKVDPEINDIIREQPKAMADFLRTVQEAGLTSEQIEALTRGLKPKK